MVRVRVPEMNTCAWEMVMPSGAALVRRVVFSQEKSLLPGWPSLCPGKSASATAVVARILKVGVDVSTTD